MHSPVLRFTLAFAFATGWMIGCSDSEPDAPSNVNANNNRPPVSPAPVAQSLGVAVDEDSSVSFTLIADYAGDEAVTFNVVDGPAHGALSGTAPDLTYSPEPGYFGFDQLEFEARAGQQGTRATVIIAVNAINDGPSGDMLSVRTPKNEPVDITLVGTDPDADALLYTIASAPQFGVLEGIPPYVRYVPMSDYTGLDSFTFTVDDGQQTSIPVAVDIEVYNRAPLANDATAAGVPGRPLPILLQAVDPDGDALSYRIVSEPTHGTVTATTWTPGDAPIVYAPEPEYAGTDTIEFYANDGTVDSERARVTITLAETTYETRNEVPLRNYVVRLPTEMKVAQTPLIGDLIGAPIATADGAVAGFVVENPTCNSEGLSANDLLNRIIATLDATNTTVNTVSNISTARFDQPTDVAVTQYQLTLFGALTPTDASNALLSVLAVHTPTGLIGGLPSPPPGAVTENRMRMNLTFMMFDPCSVVVLAAFAAESEAREQQGLAGAVSDGTNVVPTSETVVSESETFTTEQGGGLADFLFVVDNSGSMSDEQNAVAQAGEEFFSAISSSGLDFQIGTITTDSDSVVGNAFTATVTDFRTHIRRGTSGSSTETGIYYAERALSSTAAGDALNGTVTALGYPRSGASMSVIVLSDEASQYTRRASGTFDVLNNLFVNRGYRVYAIVDSNDAAGSQYDDLALATNGLIADIGDTTTFAAIMQEIAVNAGGASSRIELNHRPISSSIQVRFNGILVPNDPLNGWRYLRNTNSIIFFGTAVPTVAGTVTVTYDRVVETVVRNLQGVSGNMQATLTWPELADATAYNLYFGTTANPVTPSNGTALLNVASPYVHQGLTNNQTYRYVITAVINGSEQAPSSEVEVRVFDPAVPFDFEDGTRQGWRATGRWDVTMERAAGGSYSVTDSPNGPYGNDEATTLTSPVFDLSQMTSPRLRFDHYYNTDSADRCYVDVSTDGGRTFENIRYYYGASNSFRSENQSLAGRTSSRVVIRFRFETNNRLVEDGWYLDNIRITDN